VECRIDSQERNGAMATRQATKQLERTYRASAPIVGLARDLVGRQADAWGLPISVKDAAVRSVSELVTNALAVSGAADHIKIRFVAAPETAVIYVWDGSPQEPRRTSPVITLDDLDAMPDLAGPDALPDFGGWGLGLVESLADATGATWVEPSPHHGKWVWARFDYISGPSADRA
jgi:hypothetical protein